MAEVLGQEELAPALPPPHLPKVEETQQVDAAATAAAAAAAAAAEGEIQVISIEESMQKISQQQMEQTQLIMGMQSMINDLSAKQSVLEEEIKDLKEGNWVVRAEPKRARRDGKGDRVSQAQALLSVGTGGLGVDGTTTDAEIDAIIESRKEKKQWPLKRKYCTSFSQEVELMKIRFHTSINHTHKSVRIPKIDKHEGCGLGNKEGRLICRLCSGKTINRNTSWMCATCCVPLCVDVVNGDPASSCHARWHECQDLVAVNITLNTALRERRESKKRSRDSMNLMEEAHHQQQQAAAAAAAAPNLMEEAHHQQQQAVTVAVVAPNLMEEAHHQQQQAVTVAVAAPNLMEEAHQQELQEQEQAAAAAVAAMQPPVVEQQVNVDVEMVHEEQQDGAVHL